MNQEIIELMIIIVAGLMALKVYSHIEVEKEKAKQEGLNYRAEVRHDAEVASQKIEANAFNNGFNDSPQEGGLESIVQMALSNPQIIQTLLSKKGGGAGLPATFQDKDTNVATQKLNEVK